MSGVPGKVSTGAGISLGADGYSTSSGTFSAGTTPPITGALNIDASGYGGTFLAATNTSGSSITMSLDATTNTMTVNGNVVVTGTVSEAAVSEGPLTITGGTVTVSTPFLQATQSWNAAGVTFTGMKVNVTDTASASGSLLQDFQVGGVSKFSITKAGAVTAASNLSVATGAAYQINGTSVLNATTLGSGVTGSSLTSVGTLTAGAIGSGFTAIPNSALLNPGLQINGTAIVLGGSGTVTAAAGTLTGTTLASNVVTSSLTSVGTLSAGAVPASLVTAGTFGAGTYTFPGALGATGNFNVNTTKFTVNATTGASSFANTLAIGGTSLNNSAFAVNGTGFTNFATLSDFTSTTFTIAGNGAGTVTLAATSVLALSVAATTVSGTLAVTGLATFSSKIQVGTTAGTYTNSTYFTDLATLGAVINLARPSDGAYTNSIFSYDTAAGAKNNLGIASRSDIQFVTGGAAGPSVIFAQSGAATFSSTVSMGALTATTGTFTANGSSQLSVSAISGDTGAAMLLNPVGTGAGIRNWAVAAYDLAEGDFSLRVSTAKGGNPITAGTTRLNISSAGAMTLTGTLAVTGAATLSGSASGGATIDGSVSISIANGAAYTNSAYRGMVLITDKTSGETAIVIYNNGAGTVVSQTGSQYTGTIDTASKVNVFASSGTMKVQNNLSTRNFGITVFNGG